MSAVETLRNDAKAVRSWTHDVGDGEVCDCDNGCRELDAIVARLNALASQLAHVDPAVLDLAAVVAADVAEAPLPDGWTAVVTSPSFVTLTAQGYGIATWRSPKGRWHPRVRAGGEHQPRGPRRHPFHPRRAVGRRERRRMDRGDHHLALEPPRPLEPT